MIAELLDGLCLSGSVMWARLSPHPRLSNGATTSSDEHVRRIVPTSVAPMSLFPREDSDWLMQLCGQIRISRIVDSVLSPVAQDLRRYLLERGASFFSDLSRGTGHLASQVEEALWELSAAGIVTADGFDNLRALLDPRRRQGRESRAVRGTARGAGLCWFLRNSWPHSRWSG